MNLLVRLRVCVALAFAATSALSVAGCPSTVPAEPRMASRGNVCARAIAPPPPAPRARGQGRSRRRERGRNANAMAPYSAANGPPVAGPYGSYPPADPNAPPGYPPVDPNYGRPPTPPPEAPGTPLTTLDVSPGVHVTCAVTADDDHGVRCWGSNRHLQLGSGLAGCPFPVTIPGLEHAVEVAVGAEHACARTEDGRVWCWGFDVAQLGDPAADRAPVWIPSPVANLAHADEIAAGDTHTCARLHDGTVVCWGANAHGQLGDGTTNRARTPVTVRGLAHATQLSAGGDSTCARVEGGTLVCWGANTHGQLGDGTTHDESTPVTVRGLTRVAQVAVGSEHACARTEDGIVRCWGANAFGQLGDGTESDHATPVDVPGLGHTDEIALGGHHSCARGTDGTVHCWGADAAGQLGDGVATRAHSGPVQVVRLFGAASVYAGADVSCARIRGNETYCWGENDLGQLGNGTAVDRAAPVCVLH